MYEKAIAAAKNCETNLGGALCVGGLAYVYGVAGKSGSKRRVKPVNRDIAPKLCLPNTVRDCLLRPGQRSGPYVVEASPRRLTYSHCLYVHAMYITAHKIFKTRITPKNAEKSTSDVHSVYASREN